METGDSKHVAIAPSTSWLFYQNEEPGLCTWGNEGLNHIWPMNYDGPGYSPILFESLPVLPHHIGYITSTAKPYTHGTLVNSTNVMAYGPEFSCFQQPHLYRNFICSGDKKPIIYQSHGIGEAISGNFTEDAAETSSLYPEQFHGAFGFGGITDARHQSNVYKGRIWSSNDGDVYTHLNIHCGSPTNVICPGFDHNVASAFTSFASNLVGGFWSPGHNVGGWTWMNMSNMHGINPRTRTSPFNVFPLPQAWMQHQFCMPNERILSWGCTRDARYARGDPFCSQAGLPYNSQARFSWTGLANTTNRSIPGDVKFSQLQYGYKNKGGSCPTQFSRVSPSVVAAASTNMISQSSGKPGQSRWHQPAQSSKYPAPPLKRSGIQKTPAPPQVWRRKAKTKPSISPSKPSSERVVPIHHVVWDGFEHQPTQPVGQNCYLCSQELAYAPNDYESEDEFELSNLPEVAVLPCGHVFHCECLQVLTPEEHSRDPPCFLCSGCKS